MAGLGFDDRFPRMIPSRTHSAIDWVHAGTNFLVGALMWKRNRRAGGAAFFLGANVLFNTMMTDYEYGIFRVWSFRVHGLLDYGVAATSAVLPTMLGFDDEPEAAFFHLQGGGEALIAGVSDYDDDSGSRNARHFEVHSGEGRWRVAS
jgi:hypothetical protein